MLLKHFRQNLHSDHSCLKVFCDEVPCQLRMALKEVEGGIGNEGGLSGVLRHSRD